MCSGDFRYPSIKWIFFSVLEAGWDDAFQQFLMNYLLLTHPFPYLLYFFGRPDLKEVFLIVSLPHLEAFQIASVFNLQDLELNVTFQVLKNGAV